MQLAWPPIIQGGMGVAVSSWPLARAVARCGQLGVVSGTAIDAVVARRLQLGDPGRHLRRAFDAFPVREIAARVWERYFVPGGKPAGEPFRAKPAPTLHMSGPLSDLVVVSNFAEVFLAKEGHSGLIGINLLEKIQLPNLGSLFGAMLAGVDVVLMGAGIPRAIPAALDTLAAGAPTALRIEVAGAQPGEAFESRFDPRPYRAADAAPLRRPKFLAIVSSSTLATNLARRCGGGLDGFVVEGPTAGGHNAPPRGALTLDAAGEPVYGPRDVPALDEFRDLGLPFWLGGSYGSAAGLEHALGAGATGVQVGTAFAFCAESGLAPELKSWVIQASREGRVRVRTDPQASPTGFPFKVVEVPGTIADAAVLASREPVCDLGYLRQCYRRMDGTVGYRCPAEPLADYVRKGGDPADHVGRKCVCNGLMAAAGYAQVRRDGAVEPALVTAGDEVTHVHCFAGPDRVGYSAADVIDTLLGTRA